MLPRSCAEGYAVTPIRQYRWVSLQYGLNTFESVLGRNQDNVGHGSWWSAKIYGLASPNADLHTGALFPLASENQAGQKSTVHYTIAAWRPAKLIPPMKRRGLEALPQGVIRTELWHHGACLSHGKWWANDLGLLLTIGVTVKGAGSKVVGLIPNIGTFFSHYRYFFSYIRFLSCIKKNIWHRAPRLTQSFPTILLTCWYDFDLNILPLPDLVCFLPSWLFCINYRLF